MNKNRFFSLGFYAMMALSSMSVMVSCSDNDVDELKSRVTVIEGMLGEIKQQLADSQVNGATILKAEQGSDGVWTLTLSDGKVIKITATFGGGGSSNVSVDVNSENVIVKIDDQEFVFRKGAVIN